MSLYIDIDRVTRVLLPDGWHTIANASLTFDAFELIWHECEDYVAQPRAESTGIAFIDADTGERICAPLTALLATAEKAGK